MWWHREECCPIWRHRPNFPFLTLARLLKMPTASQFQERGPESDFLPQVWKSILSFPPSYLPHQNSESKGERKRETVWQERYSLWFWTHGNGSHNKHWRPPSLFHVITLCIMEAWAMWIAPRPPTPFSFSEEDWTCEDIGRFSKEWNSISSSWDSVSL